MGLLTLFLVSAALGSVSSSPVSSSKAPAEAPIHAEGSRSTAHSAHVSHEWSLTPTPEPTSVTHPSNYDGDRMKPILGRREALNIGSPENLSPLDSVVLRPLPSKGCTTTISETYGYPCSWDGTTTMYPTTTILFQQINCNGCENVYVHKDYYFCPNQRINGTRMAGIPSTYWSTVCRPSATALARRAAADEGTLATTTDSVSHTAAQTEKSTTAAEPGPASASRTPGPALSFGVKDLRSPRRGGHGHGILPVRGAECSTTLVVQPQRSAGKTATQYASFTTSTATVDCGGCALAISTALAGYGPPGTFETTTTLPVGAVTTYACR